MYEFLRWQAQDVMSKPVTIGPDTSIRETEALLEERGFNSLPIVDPDGVLIGVVTSLDLLRAFGFDDETILPQYERVMKKPVSGIMSKDLMTIRPRTPLTRVLEKLVASRTKSVPVVDDEDRVIGIVAREDLMEALRRADAGEAPR